MARRKSDSPMEYEPVPRAAIRLFRLSWQLETWLRLLVYVELRSARPDWEEPIKKRIRDWPPSSLENDKRLHHMATPHQAALSYLTFSQLWTVISDADNWPLFAPYLPPKTNTDVRVEEVKTIRNRVAHFREPHPQDEARLELFLRDLEPGLRRFCARYTSPKIPTNPLDDPITQRLATSWERIGYGIELHRPDHGWLYAPEPHRRSPKMNANLQLMTHDRHERGSLDGVIYCLTMPGLVNKPIDIIRFLNSTERLHKDIIHLIISPDSRQISVTIPAIHGIDFTTELVAAFLDAGMNAHHAAHKQDLRRARAEWPEYVLWPSHILSVISDYTADPVIDLS
ncbi:hypothetical protein WMF28_24685 [Sorangium sp. So ce590]|uniref:hypothetical protein n=1 Tax=Sorangium sp. So ce590 TaxID=3133317 RepID=UPI003F5EA83C